MYDLDFIFDECGFSSLPDEIKRERLFNVSYDIDTGDIKLYILDAAKRFLYKISRGGIERQYSGDDPEFGADFSRLENYLQTSFSQRQIVVDAVEGTDYYVYLQDAGSAQSEFFINAIGRRFNFSQARMLEALEKLNNRSYESLQDALKKQSLSMVRVPLAEGGVKFYAQPFLYGSGIVLNDQTRNFMCRLLKCSDEDLPLHLQHGWVARDIDSDRTLLVTQFHELLHLE